MFNKKVIIFLGITIILIFSIVFYVSKKTSVAKNNQVDIIPTTLIDDKLVLENYPIKLLNSTSSFSFKIPHGYVVVPAAENLGRVRFMAESPDGRLFVTNLYSMDHTTKGKIYILSNFNTTTKRFDTVSTYLSNLRNPNSVAFYKDVHGVEWLYVALTDKLVRYQYTQGEESPTAQPETLATFPDYGLNYKYGGWHLTRTIAFHNNKLYVSVGSSCNSCEEKSEEKSRASIVEMNPDGSDQKIYASGLRNSVGIKWVGDTLYATGMSSDHLGDDRPNDTLLTILQGRHYGWPYCYEYNKKIYEDINQVWNKKSIDCKDVPLSYAAFDAHAAPLGFDYFNKLEGVAKDSIFVALHGSGKSKIGTGYKIVSVSKDSKIQDVVTGFLAEGTRLGRPVDVLNKGSNDFFFTDDYAGVVYYVYKK